MTCNIMFEDCIKENIKNIEDRLSEIEKNKIKIICQKDALVDETQQKLSSIKQSLEYIVNYAVEQDIRLVAIEALERIK